MKLTALIATTTTLLLLLPIVSSTPLETSRGNHFEGLCRDLNEMRTLVSLIVSSSAKSQQKMKIVGGVCMYGNARRHFSDLACCSKTLRKAKHVAHMKDLLAKMESLEKTALDPSVKAKATVKCRSKGSPKSLKLKTLLSNLQDSLLQAIYAKYNCNQFQ